MGSIKMVLQPRKLSVNCNISNVSAISEIITVNNTSTTIISNVSTINGIITVTTLTNCNISNVSTLSGIITVTTLNISQIPIFIIKKPSSKITISKPSTNALIKKSSSKITISKPSTNILIRKPHSTVEIIRNHNIK
jgi:hypothetical protein